MSRVFVRGLGAVSPAGWGVKALVDAVQQGQAVPLTALQRPGWSEPLMVRQVPAPASRPTFLAHPRLRRASPITHYAVSAALEALGADAEAVRQGALRLGVIFCVMTGCVNYSRRFYDEVLRDPVTASPLVFPETVFNAPSSHLAALLQTSAINYTLVGDPGTLLQGIALAANWLLHDEVESCLVLGAEEMEWLAADAYRLTSRSVVLAAGAGALYLTRQQPGGPAIELDVVTAAHSFFCKRSRLEAAKSVRSELIAGSHADLLCDGLQGISNLDAPEQKTWADWPGVRLSPKNVLGEGLMAAAAWQCVAAAEALRRRECGSVNISVVGCNQAAIGARFVLRNPMY